MGNWCSISFHAKFLNRVCLEVRGHNFELKGICAKCCIESIFFYFVFSCSIGVFCTGISLNAKLWFQVRYLRYFSLIWYGDYLGVNLYLFSFSCSVVEQIVCKVLPSSCLIYVIGWNLNCHTYCSRQI